MLKAQRTVAVVLVVSLWWVISPVYARDGVSRGLYDRLEATRPAGALSGKNVPQTASPEAVMEDFRSRLKLAETAGLVRTGPYALRLLYLQGADEDRRAIIELTAGALKLLEKLEDDIEVTLEGWRADLKKLVTVVPELEELQETVGYKTGWVRFYRGMALAESDAKSRLLTDAIADLDKYAAGGAETGVKFWSLLVCGMAQRQLGRHEEAGKLLAAAAAEQASPTVRIEAMFQIARNLIEQGDFERARSAVEAFGKTATDLLGSAGRMQADVNSAMLLNFLYDRWADRQPDPQKKQAYRLEAEKSLLAFIDSYTDPDIQEAFFEIVATRYRGRSDYDVLGSMILLAIAGREQSQGTAAETLAEQLLRRILLRKDPVSVHVRPLALWRLGFIMNGRKQNIRAGRLFLAIAKGSPQHRLAFRAAENAVISFHGVIEERRRAKKLLAGSLREEFIKALELLLGRWGSDPRVGRWYYNLGWQYQELCELLDGAEKAKLLAGAIDAYEKVPPELPEFMEARYLGLELRVGLLRTGGGAATLRRRKAQELVGMLMSYGGDAAAAAGKTDDKAFAESLRSRGAQAEFYAAEILYNELDQRSRALQALKSLPARWPGTAILPDSEEFEIRKLLEASQIDRAIEKVEAFRQRYPRQGGQLIHLLLRQIRQRIRTLRDDPRRTEELGRYRAVYLRFSRDLHDRAGAQKLGPRWMYAFKKMYADALLEASRPAEALELFEQAAAYDAELRRREAGSVDEKFEEKLKAIDAAKHNIGLIKQLAAEYFAMLSASGLKVEDSPQAEALKSALDFLGSSRDTRREGLHLAVVARKAKEAYVAMRDSLKSALPVDAENIHGLARAHRELKEYDKALKRYGQLVRGIDRSRHPALYWSVQLDRCRCFLEACGDNAESMRRLVTLIRQLRIEDPRMGGLGGKFDAIAVRADRLATEAAGGGS